MPSVTELVPGSGLRWNEIVYADAMDGLRTLPDKFIDLGFADPPFNIDLESNMNAGKTFSEKKDGGIAYYDDLLGTAEYEAWCKDWLLEMIRVCRKVIVYCGNMNVGMFHRIREPLDVIVYFTKFNVIITPSAWAGRYRPLLVYADDKNAFLGRPPGDKCKFDTNVIVKSRQFFDKSEERDRKALRHPCPIDRELIHAILVQMKPRSFLDPFAGSGTTIYAAKRLGIERWIGFEKNPAYRADHEFLLGKARRAAVQSKLV
jgi:modification methylase